MTAMTAEEFQNLAGRYSKGACVALFVPFGIWGILGIAYTLAFKQGFEARLATRFGSTLGELLAISPVALLTIVALGVVLIRLRRLDRQSGLPCVHCGKSLAEFPRFVLAKHTCPRCGERVIEENPSRSSVMAMNVEEFKQSAAAYAKGSIACLIPFGILLILMLAYAPSQRNVESWLKSRFGPNSGELVAVGLFVLGVFLAVVAVLTLLYRNERQFGIRCAHCKEPLAKFRHIVAAGRHCPHCGKRVIEEHPGST